MIYFSSDLHFNHNKEFLYKPRGFDSVDAMNITIVNNWNSIVTDEDDVYILGDLMLGDNELGISLLKKLNGQTECVTWNGFRIEIVDSMPKVPSPNTIYFIKSSIPVVVDNGSDS